MRDLRSAGLHEKLSKGNRVAPKELFLPDASKPWPTIGEQELPSPNGEPIPIHIPFSFPGARGGEPNVACEDVRREANSDEAHGEMNYGPAEDVRCPHQCDHTSRPRQ